MAGSWDPRNGAIICPFQQSEQPRPSLIFKMQPATTLLALGRRRFFPAGGYAYPCTRKPLRATERGNTVPPASVSAALTRWCAPSSTKKTTQPPPPAPQTFAARPPLRRDAAMSLSISGVLIVGALVRRC